MAQDRLVFALLAALATVVAVSPEAKADIKSTATWREHPVIPWSTALPQSESTLVLVLPNRTLLLTDPVILGFGYVTPNIRSIASRHRDDGHPLVPGAGPFVSLSERGCSESEVDGADTTESPDCEPSPPRVSNGIGLLTVGLSQLGGAVAVALGFVAPKGGAPAKRHSKRPRIMPMMMGVGGYGAAVRGQFD